MKSATLPSFWSAYEQLENETKRSARKVYRLWTENPFHPSLHFKCINREESLWAVRINRACCAVGILEGDQVTWFWIGGHNEYEQFFG
jgi:NADH:ubiquinone oxidoreductase subunit B-like Fe-S oxidoreductase